MLRSTKLTIELSERRERINVLLDKPELSDEERTERDGLAARLLELEPELRAALASEAAEGVGEVTGDVLPGMDAETRERLDLRAKATLTGYVTAHLAGRPPGGAEAEYRAAEGAGEGIPLALFDGDPRKAPEARVDAVTPAPGTVGVNLQPIRPMVFAPSIAGRLGIDMPRVMSGTYAEARISTALTAGAKAAGAEAEATAAAFTVETTTVKRVSARMAIRAEDVASVGAANFEASLRQNLSLALSDELDKQALSGDGTGANISGIFTELSDPANPSDKATFDSVIATYANLVDGLWATTLKDVGCVVGPATYQLAEQTFQTADNYAGETSVAAYLRMNAGGMWTNSRMPAAASNVQQAIAYRMGQGGIRKAVCPHWGNIGIEDVYTGAAKAERYLSFHVLLGDVILIQPDAYKQVSFKLA